MLTDEELFTMSQMLVTLTNLTVQNVFVQSIVVTIFQC